MRFFASHDFLQPRAVVLARLADPARLEDVLLDLGAECRRVACAQGAEWQGALHWRGAARGFAATLQDTMAGRSVGLSLRADLADALVDFHVDDLAGGGCRVEARAEVSAHRMMARIALRSMAMMRGRLETRLERLIQALGRP